MEQYDDTFESVDAPPTIKEIEKRRKLGCTKEQVSRHLDQVTKSRSARASEKRNKNRQHKGLALVSAQCFAPRTDIRQRIEHEEKLVGDTTDAALEQDFGNTTML